MKILYARVFGIGNAVCSIPAIKALRSLGHQVDVLVGTTPDDFGASVVLNHRSVLGDGSLHQDHVPGDREYDLAILAIPFDGRWKNGVHFHAKEVIDGGTRPDPSTTGLVSWKKHESEYQMDYARRLGFSGETPDCSFFEHSSNNLDHVFVGVGYKKDAAGFWKVKHWGNENFSTLVQMLLGDPKISVICTGDFLDAKMTISPMAKKLGHNPRFSPILCSLPASIAYMSTCGVYVGNDTGMMHVAASLGLKVVAFFNIPGASTKSKPLCSDSVVFEGFKKDVFPEDMYRAVQEFRNAKT